MKGLATRQGRRRQEKEKKREKTFKPSFSHHFSFDPSLF